MNKIAIIGMSGLFPGSSTSDDFWQNLMEGKNLTGMANTADFGHDPATFYQEGKGVIDKCYSLKGGYIRNFEFDPNGYQLDANYLAKQDKLYQWSLYVARAALADAGYVDHKDILQKCGVILGNLSFPTGSSHRLLASMYTETSEKAIRELLGQEGITLPTHEGPLPDNKVLEYTPSEMVAEALGLGGTHYALDAACATSLYAIKLACDELIAGKSDLMLAGAVCASDQLFIHMGFSIFHAYAPMDKKFVPLDKDSAGLISAEGAGMVALKRLEDAERDGDKILGVIGGIGLSNDGRGKFLLSPNPKGQKLAFERAYTSDNLFPKDTQYLECHATGTPLGDVTELGSTADFFQQYGNKPMLGSVKSNMGHLLTGAGMSGLLKVLLSMENDVIPPNINLENGLEADNGWLGKEQMILEPTPWKESLKQAAVNSFGFGGTNAHLVVQNTAAAAQNEVPLQKVDLQPMAIIGMDAHFGDCRNIEDFYNSIFYGRQHFSELPATRWNGFEANKELLAKYGLEQAPKGAYIEDFEIDLLRFKIQPQEAETLEPQQALILKVADNAIKDAGLSESENVAVLIAMESELAIHHYLARWDATWQVKQAIEQAGVQLSEEQLSQLEELTKNAMYYREGSQSPSQHTSFVGNIMASRIAALWDYSGPAFTVSCGEQSTLKALEIAQNILSLGEVDAVVVGGVDFAGGLENVLLRQQDNACQTGDHISMSWDTTQTGWAVGEGAGAIVLKRADQIGEEKVYAQIDAIAANAITPEVDYVELLASGIAVQDQEERAKVLAYTTQQPLALGAVKANIGHTYAASGIAALIKTALCLYHRFIPAIPQWTAPKQATDFGVGQYYFPQQSRPWIKREGQNQRQALVHASMTSSILMTEGASVADNSFLVDNTASLFTLRGDDAIALNKKLAALEIALATEYDLLALAQQFASENQKGKYCLALLATNKVKLQQDITFFSKQTARLITEGKVMKTPTGSYFTGAPLGANASLAFVYPGSATAYPGLGESLFQLFPDLYNHFESKVPSLAPFLWTKYLYPQTVSQTDATPIIQKDAIAMMSVGVFFSAAFTHVLREYFKVEPKAAMGYSMGECSSMWYSLGVWDANEAKEFQGSPIFKSQFSGELELLAKHWNISTEEAKACWQSQIVLASPDQVRPLVDGKEHVYLTFINSPNEVIISGDKDACQAIIKALGCGAMEVPFQNIIHHDFCAEEYEGLLSMHNFPLQERPSIDFYSSISGGKLPLDSEAIAKNSTDVCCQSVDFIQNVENAYAAGQRIFIELGANSTCTNWIQSILGDRPHLAVTFDQKGKTIEQSMLEMVAQLASHGVELDLSCLYPAAATTISKRKYLKSIIPGGRRIYDYMLTAENKQLFQGVEVLATASVAPSTAAMSVSQSGGTSTSATVVPQEQHKQQHYSNTTIMDTTTTNVATDTSTKEQIGENGLKIFSFEDDAHLEGKNIVFSREDLVEFATGKIGKVFGPEYDIIDTYRRRVMLPMEPYLLVSRVTGLNAKTGEFKPSTMQTEYDIPHGAWFTTDRQIPWAVSVESGQCDLMLISYLGIDFQNKGDLVYRLLDCTLTFKDDLPFEGQTLRYDISINNFVRNGDNLLFFFSYRCYVQDRLVLEMDGGCAGFFTDEQLAEGNGVVYKDSEIEARKNAKKRYFTPLLNTPKRSFSKDDLRHLINGDMEKCFGDISYYANGRNPSLCLPPEEILMLDRITSVDLQGGAYGLGLIVAEKDLAPDDWYFPCHFRDDEVLAGSLQAEGGGNLLRFFMLMLGLQRLTKDARYQPVFDLPQKVRCRKEVSPQDTKLVYRLEIKEIGLVPNPYVIGDLEILSDDVVTVHFENLGLQLREKDNPKYLEKEAGVHVPARSEGALLNELDITRFALDDLSRAFGPDFAVYDGRKVSRQPNTDLQVISRILKIDGNRGDFSKPSVAYAEYDVPVDAWYYTQNSTNTMPYSVLMEIALQPCGLLGAYLGSTLKFPDQNLYFRNLDGNGEMFDLPAGTDFRGKTITNKATLLTSVALGGTIIQNYTFECAIDGHVFYKGGSSFGFFPEEALAQQVGLDNGQEVAPWYVQQGLTAAQYRSINLDSPYGKMKLFTPPAGKPHYHIANDQLNFLDSLIAVKDGGEHGKGYIYAKKAVKTYDWFFTCHFYQDPVMPGSLGVEAILQALQVYALTQEWGKELDNPKFVQLDNHKTTWKYRGQILTHSKEMQLEVHVKSVDNAGGKYRIIADAYLWNGNTRIYQITDLALGIE